MLLGKNRIIIAYEKVWSNQPDKFFMVIGFIDIYFIFRTGKLLLDKDLICNNIYNSEIKNRGVIQELPQDILIKSHIFLFVIFIAFILRE